MQAYVGAHIEGYHIKLLKILILKFIYFIKILNVTKLPAIATSLKKAGSCVKIFFNYKLIQLTQFNTPLALSITTLSLMTFRVTTLSIMTLSITTLSITTLSITTLSITSLSIVTLSIMTFRHHLA